MDSTPKRKLINKIRLRKKQERERLKAENGGDASSSDSDEPLSSSTYLPERNLLMPFNSSPKTPLRCISNHGITSTPGSETSDPCNESNCYSPPTPSYQESEKLMKMLRREQKRNRRLAKNMKPAPGLLNNTKFLISLEDEEPELLDQSSTLLEMFQNRLEDLYKNQVLNKEEINNPQSSETNNLSRRTSTRDEDGACASNCVDPSSSSTQSSNDPFGVDCTLLNDSTTDDILLECLLRAESGITQSAGTNSDTGNKELGLLDEDDDYFLAVNIP